MKSTITTIVIALLVFAVGISFAPKTEQPWMWTLFIMITVNMIFLAAATPFVMVGLAKKDLFYTTIKSGELKYIVRGASFEKILHDVRGKKLAYEDGKPQNELYLKFVNGEEKDQRSWLQKKLGIYPVGIPNILTVKSIPISKKRENLDGKGVENWIKEDKEISEETSLRFVLPRPYLFRDIEFGGQENKEEKDRTTVNLLIVVKFEIVRPYIPIFMVKGDFFVVAGSMLSAAVNNVVKKYTQDSFIEQDKGEGGIFKELEAEGKDTLNEKLIEQVGLKLVGISAPMYDPSDAAVREAMQARKIASLKGQATIATAQADAEATRTKGQAEADVIRIKGEAKGEAAEKLVAGLGGDTKEAAKVLQRDAQPNLSTLVEGGGKAGIVISGDKK